MFVYIVKVDEQEFVRHCTLDPELGSAVLRVFRAVISTWSFLYERWSTGMFFTQTRCFDPASSPKLNILHCSF